MGNLKDEALAYESQKTHNIADLPEVSVDLDVQDDEFTAKDENGQDKTVKQKVIIVEGCKYRVPVTVLNKLKVMLEDNPNMKKFKVKKTGTGLGTDYTVIPMN